jgi:alpha-glutamyl/putrescinyl thymine pyrophosphorylase clade 1/Lamin-B receptor of TUDOR domain
MSLLTWFKTKLPVPERKIKFEEVKFDPCPIHSLNPSDDAKFESPHPVTPDASPATKSEILLRPAVDNVPWTSVYRSSHEEESEQVDIPRSSAVRKRMRKYVEQTYPIGARVRKHFYGYVTPFWGIVTRYDPRAQYYGVTYVADGDEEEYDEFELSQIIVNADDQKGVEDDLPKYGIGTQVGKWFGPKFYFGTITSYDAESEYYLITYEDGDQEDVEEQEVSDLISAVQENWDGQKGYKKKFPRLIKTEDTLVSPEKTPVENELYPTPEDLCLWANIGLQTENEVAAVLQKLTFIPVMQRRSVVEFFLFLYVRHEWFRVCQLDRQTGAPAVTPNRAIREHDFCNVYRELDKDVQWIRPRLTDLYTGDDMTRREWTLQVLWTCYNYRQVGRTDTFLKLGFPKLMFQEPKTKDKALTMAQFNDKSVQKFLKGMRKLMAEGSRVFTGDYQTPPMRMYEKFVMTAIADGCALLQQVADAILDYDPNDVDLDFFTYHKKICKALQTLPGISYFFGWQLFCDLEEAGCIPRHPSMSLERLKEGPTEPSFVLLGGGARKGLNIVFGHGKVSYDQQLEEVNFMIQKQLPIFETLGVRFDYWNGQAISGKVLECVIVLRVVLLLEVTNDFWPVSGMRFVNTSSIVAWSNV